MKIKRLSISWFRGAASETVLLPLSKSLAVYGPNGSGKSSFVDAIELILRGKVEHLAHEYSGRRQEKGLVNTHKPSSESCRLNMILSDDSRCDITIDERGTIQRSADCAFERWDYNRHVLRQSSISECIHSQKADRYSSVLPLLNLGEQENLAQNLDQIARRLRSAEHYKDLQNKYGLAREAFRAAFPRSDAVSLERAIAEM